MPAPGSHAATGRKPTQLRQPQSTFAVIPSRRCTQPTYSTEYTPSAMSALKRLKVRIQALATASKLSKSSQPKDSYESPEETKPPQLHSEGILETRIQDRLKAIGTCSPESVIDADTAEPIPDIPIPTETEEPIPAIPIPEETPDDPTTAPFDVHTTLLCRVSARLAAAKAFNLGLPAPDREELEKLCNEFARRAEEGPGIMWSLEGTYVPRGVPKGRMTRFVETGLLEVEGEMGLEAQSEEDSLVAENAALAVEMSTKSVRGRVRDLWKTRRQGREWGLNSRERLIKA
ncbi:hypothetical protein V496_07306 [Pseudogymnoascus sp. VKM F-4515 (FW-2607)]|nr:hypothetical protein V496_07306 [Pseudogymnoascus sp. VKM F-4515 (FW-2607)]